MMRRQNGMVLLIVLLLLAMVTLLIMTALDTSLLESKMGINYIMQKQFFYGKEGELRQNEQRLLNDPQSLGEKPLQSVKCIDFYHVTVNDEKNNNKPVLQSTVAKIKPLCVPIPKVKNGRQSISNQL